MQGMLTVVLFWVLCLHSSAVLLKQGTVVLTQFVDLSFVQGTVVIALATHITAPLLVHRDVVLAGQKEPVSPTQVTTALDWITASFGTSWLLW